MAIVVDAGNISGSGDQGNQSTYNWQHTNSVDVKVLVAVVRTRDTSENDSDISSIVYDSDGFTNAVKLYDAGSDMGVQVWWLANPTADAAGHTLTVTFNGAVSDSSVAVIGLEGAETTSPVDLTDTDVVASGNVTLDFTGRASGAIAIGGSVLDENTPNKLSVITGTQADEVDMGSYQANSAYNLGDTIVMGSADGDVAFVGAGATFKEGAAPPIELEVTDGVKGGDTTAETMAANPTVTDGIDGGDTTLELSQMAVSVSDGTKIGDTPLGVILSFPTVTDGIDLGDTTLETMLASPVITDGVKVGDTTTELGVMETLVSDGVEFGDTAARGLMLLLALTDGIKAGDTTVESMTTDSIVTDGTEIGDSTSETMASIAIVSDGAKFGDTPLESMVAAIAVTDGIKVGDTTVNILAVYPVVSDGAIFGDTVLIESGGVVYQLTVTDGVKIGDTPGSEMATFTVVVDGVKIGDLNIVEMLAQISAIDGAKIGDITVGNINYEISVSDGVKLGELITETLTSLPRGVKNLGKSRELVIYERFLEIINRRTM